MPLSRSEIEEYFDLDPGAIDEVERQIKENHEKNEQARSKYKPVAGRRKLPEGKKARPEKKGSTEFEMELVHYLIQMFNMPPAVPHHVWRSPSSESPVDVWSIAKNIGTEKPYGSMVCCHQCKTTKDTKPPRIDKREFDNFVAFCNGIGAKALWVDRWKKNKNVYIRRIRFVDPEGQLFTHEEDFSNDIKRGKKLIGSTSQARI